MTKDSSQEVRMAGGFWILAVGLLILGLLNLCVNPEFPSAARGGTACGIAD